MGFATKNQVDPHFYLHFIASILGYCNCKMNYVGESCDFLYQDVICPYNCSGQGVCSLNQGICICNNKFNGKGCDNYIGSVLTSIQNVNNSQYLAVDKNSKVLINIPFFQTFLFSKVQFFDQCNCFYLESNK